jgi:murein DD-endopeptidase MepM/ murein hydrolase activator NlpD
MKSRLNSGIFSRIRKTGEESTRRKYLPEWVLGICLFLLLNFTFSRIMYYNYMIPAVDQKEDIIFNEPKLLYGLPADSFHVEENRVRLNESLSDILSDRGVSSLVTDRIAHLPSSVFDLRRMKAGNDYALFYSKDSVRTPLYFVYAENQVNYYTYRLNFDSCSVIAGKNEVTTERKIVTGVISSSLWKSIQENNLDPMMAIFLQDIFAWTIDFFAIQKGDHFSVIFDQDYVKGEPLGIGTIHAAVFNSSGQDFYAIHFEQEDGQSFFDDQGKSIRKEFLKAPLKIFRISSRFSGARMHPVLRIVRPHFGVDYAAPTGTPVYSIGDGIVQTRAYQAGGGGNFIKIKHNSVYTTTYMHLSRFAPGIQVGSRVKQAELIGFVGSTGLASGPHLDFRVFKSGFPVDPLNIKSPPADPVSDKNLPAFKSVRDKVIKELKVKQSAALKQG